MLTRNPAGNSSDQAVVHGKVQTAANCTIPTVNQDIPHPPAWIYRFKSKSVQPAYQYKDCHPDTDQYYLQVQWSPRNNNVPDIQGCDMMLCHWMRAPGDILTLKMTALHFSSVLKI
jgi:hypothetical protein